MKEEEMSEFDELFESDADYTPTNVSKNVNRRSRKPKVVSDWSDDDVFKLIACVEERPALWDAQDSQYRNKHERTKLWNEMSKNDFCSKFEDVELLAKWTNIRIQYRSYAIRKPKSGQVALPPITWKFYPAMTFIGQADISQTASTESNLMDEESKIDIIRKPTIKRKRRLSVSTVTSSVKTLTSSATVVAESVKAAVESFNEKKIEQHHTDEFDTFGKFLSSELRSLEDIAMARRIKLKLNRYFLDLVEQEQKIKCKCKANK